AFAEYQRHGRVWIDRFGHRPLRCILPLDVQAWATRRRAEVEPATVNRELSFLRRVFSVALANGLVERNPVKAVKFFHEPSGRVRFLTQSARKLICATARTRRRGPPTTPRSLTSSEPQAAKSLGRPPHAPTPS